MEAWREELYLSHHGIDGQKWGKKNGPPYPLDYNDHSAAEKKGNSKGSLDNYSNNKPISKRQARRYARAEKTINKINEKRNAKLAKNEENRKANYKMWDVEIDAAKKGETRYSVKQTKDMRAEEDQIYADKAKKINAKYDVAVRQQNIKANYTNGQRFVNYLFAGPFGTQIASHYESMGKSRTASIAAATLITTVGAMALGTALVGADRAIKNR